MKHSIQTPRDFINPLLSKRSVIQSDIEKFQISLEKLLHVNIIESEEHQKNAVRDFLVDSFGYTINTKGKIDWAIFKDGKVEVLIEAKRLDNNSEMITLSELNRKALHEAVLYFMQERDEGNNTLKHIIILTAFKWFIFDAKEFDRLFWNNRQIKKIYTNFKSPSLLGDKTKDFYEAISKELPNLKANLVDDEMLPCAYFDLSKKLSSKELIAIYKLLSPDSLLKAFNPNDANTLNREFYSELLYILGLEEVKEGGKKLIGRAQSPQLGSLYENIAGKLTQYGKPNDFESILKLMIIWINRILFLKLLESQIVKWNANPTFRFLNATKIDDFDKLEMLFFEILAKRPMDRNHREFDYIPYLNSSLFELHEMEEKSLKISNLADDANIAYYAKTVIKDEKSTKKTGQVCTLHYLFEFLDAYDFSSEGSEEVVSDNKTLINASVLGLIFEKLNGYKDGSFYTPSFITMYMAKESLTKAVLAKFLTCKGWDCQNLSELYNKIDDIKEANDIINSLTLCDPAVGSGHFLVSALNEILSIKATLGILCDAEGKKLKEYRIELANDELTIKDDEGEIFEYQRASSEKTRVQKALFKEKQRIIENSLFGVDINQNSVNICRLRLWIELLKNAYYKEDGTLDTLPNIDINIKCGNSLISRFDLKDELKIKNIKNEIENYKQKVSDYKENLGTKKEVMESINALKAKFNLSLKAEWKVQKALELKLKEYVTDFGHVGLSDMLILTAFRNQYGQIKSLFGDEVDEKKRLKLLGEVQKGEAQIDEIEKGKIYENAFEWRFEFPEVLDEKGDFVGFDVVMGNPPYFNIDSFGGGSAMLKYLPQAYPQIYMDKSDILFYFIAKATQISKGQTAFIISNAMLFSDKAQKLRNHILENNPIHKIINFEKYQVFDEASITAMMLFLEKSPSLHVKVQNYTQTQYEKNWLVDELDKKEAYFNVMLEPNSVFALVDESIAMLNRKIDNDYPKLGDVLKVGKGMETAANEVFSFDEMPLEFEGEYLKKRMSGEIIEKYTHKEALEYLLYFEDAKSYEDLSEPLQEYLQSHRTKLEERATVKNEGRAWWRYSRPMHKEFYYLPKIWCSYRAKENTFCLDESSEYIGFTNTTVIFATHTTLALKYVLALLNSKVLNFRYKSIGKQTGSGVFEYFENQISKLPIPNISAEDQQPFITLVDKILTCKASNPKADTSELEKEIDILVYALYGLNEAEVAIVEGR